APQRLEGTQLCTSRDGFAGRNRPKAALQHCAKSKSAPPGNACDIWLNRTFRPSSLARRRDWRGRIPSWRALSCAGSWQIPAICTLLVATHHAEGVLERAKIG